MFPTRTCSWRRQRLPDQTATLSRLWHFLTIFVIPALLCMKLHQVTSSENKGLASSKSSEIPSVLLPTPSTMAFSCHTHSDTKHTADTKIMLNGIAHIWENVCSYPHRHHDYIQQIPDPNSWKASNIWSNVHKVGSTPRHTDRLSPVKWLWLWLYSLPSRNGFILRDMAFVVLCGVD
jgi:hypothetical protein